MCTQVYELSKDPSHYGEGLVSRGQTLFRVISSISARAYIANDNALH